MRALIGFVVVFWVTFLVVFAIGFVVAVLYTLGRPSAPQRT